MPLHRRLTAAPAQWLHTLAQVAAAVARAAGVAAPIEVEVSESAEAVAQSLLSGERKAVLLGHAAAQHPQATELLALANWIGQHTGATVGVLGEAANSVGAQLVRALPDAGGLDAAGMLAQPRRALLLLGVEPVLDMADPQAAHAALQQAELVVAFTAFRDAAVQGAHVLLPIAPFTETAGTFVNAEGRVQSFAGVVRPRGETRPAWKVLRVLGNLLGLPGFDFESAEQVRAAALGDEAELSARLCNDAGSAPTQVQTAGANGWQRLADVPIYAADALVRRAPSLQATADARPPQASVGSALWASLGLQPGDRLRVRQGAGSVVLPARLDPSMADDTVRVPAGHADTCVLGAASGRVELERVAQAQAQPHAEEVRA